MHTEKTPKISRNLSVTLYVATVVKKIHRFVIFDLDRTRDFISRPLRKNITDPCFSRRSFEISRHLSRDTRHPGSEVKVGERSLNSRVSSSILKKHRFRDFKAPQYHRFKITDNKKRNHACGDIISNVSSRSEIADFRGVISPEFSPCT